MKNTFIEAGNVDESGKVTADDKSVSTTAFQTVEMVSLDGKKGIQTTQFIVAFKGNSILDEITTVWRYENGKWQVAYASGNRVGNLVY